MSITDADPSRPGVKTLAIRLDPELHTQLSLLAQLRTRTITDEIRAAFEAHTLAAKTAPDVLGKAEDVLADIERDAQARRSAITALLGTESSTAEPPQASSRPRRSGKTA